MSENGEKSAGPNAGAGIWNAAPGLARIAAGAAVRTVGWAAGGYVKAGSRVLRAASVGESGAQFLSETGSELRGAAARARGVADLDQRIRSILAEQAARVSPRFEPSRQVEESPTPRKPLLERGAELLRQSADVHHVEEAHPAYERMLEEIAPDEGRILRFLCLEGPQPSVDVRGRQWFHVETQLVAPGLSMIGAQAGCRYVERVPAYLNNLHRLGFVWFSREALEDPLRYQVLEAQPEVTAAMAVVRRGRTIRRSIHLTPFGDDFCKECLPLETIEIDALPVVEAQ